MRTILIAAAAVAVAVGTTTAQQTGTFTDGRDGQTYKRKIAAGPAGHEES